MQPSSEFQRRRAARNRALLIVLVAMVLLFYAITIAKLKGQG